MEIGGTQTRTIPLWFIVAKWFIIVWNCIKVLIIVILAFIALINLYILTTIFILATGAICVLGILGAYWEHFVMLVIYFVCLVVSFIFVFAAGFHGKEGESKGSIDWLMLFFMVIEFVAVAAMIFDIHRSK